MQKMGKDVLSRMTDDELGVLDEALGFLNFSGGKPDPKFRANLDRLQGLCASGTPWAELHGVLLERMETLRKASPALRECDQVLAAVRIVFEELFPAYRAHHGDLLFHVPDSEFQRPFFLACLFEATLTQGAPWEERDRIVGGAVEDLNDFLGHRPLAVLENGRKSAPYDHERFRPIPLYVRGAGVSGGRYHDLLRRTLDLFETTPRDVMLAAHFNPDHLDEVSLDLRAHDHSNPINKRTNYIFGEWDPHAIDTRGFYRRFVLRQIILDFLLGWIDEHQEIPYEERMYDAAAVLCGTILMASSISGAGPDTFSSDVSLTSLLPQVARQRDAFYARLLTEATGERRERLRAASEQTLQPFGHVRQSLNLQLSHYGAVQVQHRHLAHLFAKMGFSEAARTHALTIPSASARIECEIEWRISAAHRQLSDGKLASAIELIDASEEALHRGIRCGALIDPWNILGFQGLVPLFSSREDSVPDQRVERLLEIMEQLFGALAHALNEAAVQEQQELTARLSRQYQTLADEWDRYATTIVEDLPKVEGHASWTSAIHVSQALSEWRGAGESAGDIAFWRKHVDQFESPKAYALAINALLERQDHVAALGLLMQWLSEAEQNNVELESGPYGIYPFLLQWLNVLIEQSRRPDADFDCEERIQRFFALLEANAGHFWHAPGLHEFSDDPPARPFDEPSESSEDDLFQAAYESMVYRDSARDGNEGETLSGPGFAGSSDIEMVRRHVEPRLRFLTTLAFLWQSAVAGTAVNAAIRPKSAQGRWNAAIKEWLVGVHALRDDLHLLIDALSRYEITPSSGEHDSNVEYDAQLQTQFYLLRTAISAQVNCRVAERALQSLSAGEGRTERSRTLEGVTHRLYAHVVRRDAGAVRKLLPRYLKQVCRQPLLYVPVDNGGPPDQIMDAQLRHADLRFLLFELPRLGLLRETYQVLATAFTMERASRPSGVAVTEFDRLFRTALRCSLESVMTGSRTWRSGKFPDEELIEFVHAIVEQYQTLWIRHQQTMRLSAVEALTDEELWQEVREFIREFGGELFDTRMLTLGNVRAILHNGVDWLLDNMMSMRDPLHASPLLEAIEEGRVDREDAVRILELVYSIIDDRYDRFLEYNTTTTQSDYGEELHCLLDVLRIESAYDNDAWQYMPYVIAHEVLARSSATQATLIWEKLFAKVSQSAAKRHVRDLQERETRYGLRLPVVSDRIHERFVMPLATNRMLALVPAALEDARSGRTDSESFERLQDEVQSYLESTMGSGVDIPDWLQKLDAAVLNAGDETLEGDIAPQFFVLGDPVPLRLRSIQQQLKNWSPPPFLVEFDEDDDDPFYDGSFLDDDDDPEIHDW